MWLQLLTNEGKPFDIKANDFDGIQMNFFINSTNVQVPFSVSTLAKNPDFKVLQPTLLICAGIIGTILFINSMYKIFKPEEMFFMTKASYLSVSVLTIANFQFFGVFMVLGLNFAP